MIQIHHRNEYSIPWRFIGLLWLGRSTRTLLEAKTADCAPAGRMKAQAQAHPKCSTQVWNKDVNSVAYSHSYATLLHTDFQLRVWGCEYSKHRERNARRCVLLLLLLLSLVFICDLFIYFIKALKESFIKAIGTGLGFNLQRAQFHLSSEAPTQDRVVRQTRMFLDEEEETDWIFEVREADSGWWRWLSDDWKQQQQQKTVHVY